MSNKYNKTGNYANIVITSPEIRFWDRVIKTDTCWLWDNLTGRYGYFYDGTKDVSVHRFSYELKYGKIPEGLNVCHKCDVTHCVNPEHLFLGTQADNLKDCQLKGRKRNGPSYGEKNGNSKLTEDNVREIRVLLSQKMPMTHIGKLFSIDHSTVSSIRDCKTWGSVS
jgi:hypothetical protein